MKRLSALLILSFSMIFAYGCVSDSASESEFTGEEMRVELIPGNVQGNATTGHLLIRERNDGKASIEITLNGVLPGAIHPVHLHFGSLDNNGLVATYLNQIEEVNGVGASNTVLDQLDDGTRLLYTDLLMFDGSIKIHYEASGPLKDEILGAINIGMNRAGNEAYFSGLKSISTCNSDFVSTKF